MTSSVERLTESRREENFTVLAEKPRLSNHFFLADRGLWAVRRVRQLLARVSRIFFRKSQGSRTRISQHKVQKSVRLVLLLRLAPRCCSPCLLCVMDEIARCVGG